MPSLLQLPQAIWRDCVVYFLSKVEDLARLDSAAANRSDQATFHENIRGCKRFTRCKLKIRDCSQIKWLVLRDIFITNMEFNGDPKPEQKSYIQHLLLHVKNIQFSKLTLSHDNNLLHWTFSSNLLDVSLKSCTFDDISGLSVCSGLTDLTIFDCPNITDESFVVGIAGCAQLTRCFVLGCASLSEIALVALLQSCVELNYVLLNGRFDLEKVFTMFQSVSNVKIFNCSDSSRTLSLTGSAIRAMATALPCLGWINVDYQHSTVGDADIEVLVHECKLLTSIDLCRWPLVTDLGVLALARALKQLLALDVQNLGITDAAVQAVGTHCRQLEDLNVSGCQLLTDNAFSTLNASSLKTLQITATRVTGSFAVYLLGSESTLEMLYCYKGEQLSSDFARSITGATRLTSLILGKILFTEADWLELSTKCPALLVLRIEKSTSVTDAVALSFSDHCPRLRYISLWGCSVSPEVMNLLQTKQ